DIEVDFHHLVEDTVICLGAALKDSLGENKGIKRFSYCYARLDEALVRVCIDVSGRAYLSYNVHLETPVIVHFDAGLIEDFLRAFVNNAEITVHVDCIRGKNTHHIVEAMFKALGIAVRDASEVMYPDDEVPSTKGML
ncbi:MAG: imidazoleglycerol-phosphate dehydratase, partial [Spirochaetota bacterium]